jgi:hypothetical protein
MTPHPYYVKLYSVLLKDISQEKLAVERYQSVSRIMVWGAIFKKSKTIYSNMLRTCIEKIIFASNKTLGHLATRTQEWLTESVPDFLTHHDWPASSADLNPLDYWGYILGKIDNTKHTTLSQFKTHLMNI